MAFLREAPLSRAVLAGAEGVEGGLFDEGQQAVIPAAGLLSAEALVGVADPTLRPAAGWKLAGDLVVVECAEPELFEVVLALRAACGFARRLDGGEEQCDEDADDGNHHQQFD